MIYDEKKDTGIVIISNGDDEGVDEDALDDGLTDLIRALFEAGELMGK